jgi:hypothetical protein
LKSAFFPNFSFISSRDGGLNKHVSKIDKISFFNFSCLAFNVILKSLSLNLPLLNSIEGILSRISLKIFPFRCSLYFVINFVISAGFAPILRGLFL